MAAIQLDLNDPKFQASFFELESEDALRAMACLRKISRMSWQELYRAPGLKWEAIESRHSREGHRLYTFRISQKSRAVGFREGNRLRLLLICPDHDSAYN